MKRFFIIFSLVFALAFVVSCGSSSKNNKDDNTDTTDTEAPDNADSSDTEEPDSEEPYTEGSDTEGPDTEEPDTEGPDTEEPDMSDSANEDDSDNSDSESDDDTDNSDSESDDDTDFEDDDADPESDELAKNATDPIGKFTDNFGATHYISKITWFQPSVYGDSIFHIKQYNIDNDFIIAQNDAVKSFNPEKWSRFDYAQKGKKLYYCQIAFDKNTEAEALAVTDADKTDLEKGCNDNPWTELIEVVETGIDKDSDKIVAWATGYEDYIAGGNVDEKWKTPEKALGKAKGDSFDVVVLGNGGSIILTFDKPITDGEGADFAVFENSTNDIFLEIGTVEVSSDGENFVTFDHYYLGVEAVEEYGGHDAKLIWGFAGKFRQGTGNMFDLAELAEKPEVKEGKVDLNSITHVKIVDVIGDGNQLDSIGDPIYDPYPNKGSAGFDLDAIAVINEKE